MACKKGLRAPFLPFGEVQNIMASSLPRHSAVRNNFLDSFVLILPSPASGELEMKGRGVKACFDGRSDSDDIFKRKNI